MTRGAFRLSVHSVAARPGKMKTDGMEAIAGKRFVEAAAGVFCPLSPPDGDLRT
jgi:hypothetical protein